MFIHNLRKKKTSLSLQYTNTQKHLGAISMKTCYRQASWSWIASSTALNTLWIHQMTKSCKKTKQNITLFYIHDKILRFSKISNRVQWWCSQRFEGFKYFTRCQIRIISHNCVEKCFHIPPCHLRQNWTGGLQFKQWQSALHAKLWPLT